MKVMRSIYTIITLFPVKDVDVYHICKIVGFII